VDKMEEEHKEAIKSNLKFLCSDVDYSRLRPEMIKHRLFPERHLQLMEEKVGNIKLEVFMQVQRRGPTAFRRLIASLKFSGHDESVRALTRNDRSLLMNVTNTDSYNPQQSFDLTDSPIHPSQIQVEPASILREEDKMTYKMTSQNKGMALIIDNEEFETLPPRRGSHVDTECLAKLFQQLGFWVIIKKNLRKVTFEYELLSFATDNIHHQMDMAIVCVLSHGEDGVIICTDGQKIPIEAILGKFNNRNALPLRGKPKYFLFQACRGLKIDPGVETDGPNEEILEDKIPQPRIEPNVDNINLARDPSFEDIFVSYATIPTYVAYRNNLKGSWFVQCLCRVFMQYSCSEDLDTLLLRVTQELRAYCTTRGEKQINETLLRGVTKKLFFNPGVFLGQNRGPSHNHPLGLGHQSASHRSASLELTGVTNFERLHLDEVWSGIGIEMGPCAV